RNLFQADHRRQAQADRPRTSVRGRLHLDSLAPPFRRENRHAHRVSLRSALARQGTLIMHMIDLPAHEQQLYERLPMGWGGRWYGVFPAQVLDVKDPDNQGRVKITLPWSPDAKGGRYEAWARLATLFGGNNRGSWFVPDVDDEVLVAFEQGDARRPYVLRRLWKGRAKRP